MEIQEREIISRHISEALISLPQMNSSNFVAAFFPMKSEPNIFPVLLHLAKKGKLLLPRCVSDTQMNFHYIDCEEKLRQLRPGRFGILEPEQTFPIQEEISLFLVPGEKFSLKGERIGHGKGYYDRFLSQYPSALKIGVCFPEKIVPGNIPQKPHDIKMDKLVFGRDVFSVRNH